jgi:hypothetical protein
MTIGDHRTTFPTTERRRPETSPPPPRRVAAWVSSTPDRLARRPPRGFHKLEPVVVLHYITGAAVGNRATTTIGAR